MNAKRLILISLLPLVSLTAGAQVARWVIHPEYDSLQIDMDNAIITGVDGGKTTFWTEDGSLLGTTEDRLHPFREGLAVTTAYDAADPDSLKVTGFFSKDGSFVPTGQSVLICGWPYFSDGFLLVKQKWGGRKYYYRFVDSGGGIESDFFSSAHPFNAGLAVCCKYGNRAKEKKPMHYYVTTGLEPVEFTLNGKAVGADDVDFISSLSDDGIGIVAIKSRFYYYSHPAGTLVPMFEKEGETDKKKQVVLKGDMDKNIRKDKVEEDSLYVVSAEVRKYGRVEIFLDSLYVPVKVRFGRTGAEKVFMRDRSIPDAGPTSISVFDENGKWAVAYNGTPVTAGIFDEVNVLKGNSAFVRMDGKWGMIAVEENGSFRFTINKGNSVGFRHKNYETSVRLDLPGFISSAGTRFEILEKDSFNISGNVERGDTEHGNYVQCNCTIDIPDTLSDTMGEMECRLQVTYDRLVSPVIPVAFSAWHVKRFNVDIIDQTAVRDAEFSFTVKIVDEQKIDKVDYPFEVSVTADSLSHSIEKLSETRYKITLGHLAEGANQFSVNVYEDGCPPQHSPFEVIYTKPVPKTRETEAVKPKVEIRRKTKYLPPL